MTTSTNFHRLTEVQPMRGGSAEWLNLAAEDGNSVAIFMPYAAAKAMADAYAAAMTPAPEVEGAPV